MSEELICITCPMGCHLSIDRLPNGGISVGGNRCPRGVVYANAELLDPRRTVTATCRVTDRELPRVPCRTVAPFPKDRVAELLDALYDLTVTPPVRRGDILLADALGTGINVIATRSIDPR